MKNIIMELECNPDVRAFDTDGNVSAGPTEPKQTKQKHGDNKGGIMTKASKAVEDNSQQNTYDSDGNAVMSKPQDTVDNTDDDELLRDRARATKKEAEVNKKLGESTIPDDIFDHMVNEGLVDHAKYEMDMVGLFDTDSDYEGMLGQSVMDLMTVFAGQGHSGASAAVTRDLFGRLSNYETLSSITNNPEEWNDVTGVGGVDSPKLWQSKRNPALFSLDGGMSYYHVDDPNAVTQSEKGIASLEPREDEICGN